MRFYSVTVPLHVSGLLVAHNQELKMYICNSWYVLYVLVDCHGAWLEWNWFSHSNQTRRQSTKTCNTYQLLHIYIITS
jgi:hypothetical protein